MRETIGFIGAGNMGKAMIEGICQNHVFNTVWVCDHHQENLDVLHEKYGVKTSLSEIEVAQNSDVLVLSVKPKHYPKVIETIKGSVKSDVIIVDIAAGVTILDVKTYFGKDIKVIKAMPNTPALVLSAMSAISFDDLVTEEDKVCVQSIFNSFGKCEVVEETMMDAVTSVSGSSPAYVFMFIEAMADAAVAQGLPRNKAYTFAAQAVLGSAKMVLETGMHPGTLKDMVCSPGGTTIDAVCELERIPERLAAFKNVKLDLEFGKITTIHTLNQLDCEKVVVVGLGDGKKNIKEAFSKVEADDYLVYVTENTAYAAGFGLVYGAYSYKETKVYDLESDGFKDEFEKGKTVARIVNHAREMSDMPANFLTPDHLVDEAKMVAEKYDMEIEVLAQDDLEEIGAGALLAVNQGSDRPCFMVVIRYDGGKEDEDYTALVGKGLTYDAGGYNIKSNMHGMKYDMCGAANMLCALELLAELKVEKNIVCVLPITENKVNGHGFVDGDVITSLSGKTIEVTNTDAEGRLILADALTMAQKLGATRVIDMATLTGACVRALGSTYTGIFSNDDSFYLPFLGASKATKEQVWRLPVDEYFHSELKCSKVADIINSKTLGGNASLAAAFLEEFIEEGTQWIHLDIAGTSDKDEVATGVMIETIVHFLENECK